MSPQMKGGVEIGGSPVSLGAGPCPGPRPRSETGTGRVSGKRDDREITFTGCLCYAEVFTPVVSVKPHPTRNRPERLQGSETRIKGNLEPGAVIQPELWVAPGQTEEEAVGRGGQVLGDGGPQAGWEANRWVRRCRSSFGRDVGCITTVLFGERFDLATHPSYPSTRKTLLKRSV